VDNFAKGWKDGEPDLFFFNFGGYSGKFYFRDDRTPILVPEQDIQIIPQYTGLQNQSIQGFTCITPDGVKYVFGASATTSGAIPVEMTNPIDEVNGLSSANIVSSWFLTKVSTSDDQYFVSFSYIQENYAYHTFSMFPFDPNASQNSATPPSFGSTHGYSLIKNIVKGVRLSQITFKNGQVNFIGQTAPREDLSDVFAALAVDNVNQEAKALASIEISNGTSVLRKFNLSYSYFNDATTAIASEVQNFAPGLQTDRKRLRLDQVQEVSGDGSITNPPYAFSYFGEMVPRRLSFGFDHWGFINGSNSNQTPVPSYTVTGSNGNVRTFSGGDRSAHWPAMRGGLLSNIIYPTGGSSNFEFETNTALVTTSTTRLENLEYQLRVPQQGQSSLTTNFNFSSNGLDMTLSVSNTANSSCTLRIYNASGQLVFPYTPLSETFQENTNYNGIVLSGAKIPAGAYTGQFILTPRSGLSGFATLDLQQLVTTVSTSSVVIGGNRIRTVTNSDGFTTVPVVTRYEYLNDGGNSSAILYSRPVYVGIVRNDLIKDIGVWNPATGFQPYLGFNGCTSSLDATYYASPSSIRPMATTQGYHIGYSRVKVSQPGNGYSIYKYYGNSGVPFGTLNNVIAVTSISNSGCDVNAPNYPPAPLPFEFARGELQYEGHFIESGKRLKETTYQPTYVEDPFSTPAFIVSSHGSFLLGTNYELKTSRKTQNLVTETTYGPADEPLTKMNLTEYLSPFHHQVTNIKTLNSTGDILETKLKYAADFRVSTCDQISQGTSEYSTLQNSCLINYNNSRQSCAAQYPNANQAAQRSGCLTNAYLTYQQCRINNRVALITYRRESFTDPNNTFAQRHLGVKNNVADGELKPILELQDKFQNPAIEVSKWKSNLLLGSSFSRYDFDNTGSSNVYINKVQTVSLAIPSNTFIFSATNASDNSIIKDSRYKDEMQARFTNGNMSEMVSRDRVFTSYIWGYNNTLPIVKAVGADYNTLTSALNAVGGNVNLLRTHPSLQNAQISLYLYDPLIGITKENDLNGKSTTYEYDALQRLRLMRDFNNHILKKYDYKYQSTANQ
jgi:hypothetical protein